MKILIRLHYDGGAYHGFQYQPGRATIQGSLTHIASLVFGLPCHVTGCSRTDAGVHATGFCATIEPAAPELRDKAWCGIPVGKIYKALNHRLPSDIAVSAAAVVPDDFHPRYDALSKEYLYRLYNGRAPDPHSRAFAYYVRRSLSDGDISRMREAAQSLIGYHDFSAFMAAGSSVTDARRTVSRIDVRRESGGMIHLYVAADGFLYHMVRIITGTLLEVGTGRCGTVEVARILDSRDRRQAGATAPPHGLYLQSVTYKTPIEWQAE